MAGDKKSKHKKEPKRKHSSDSDDSPRDSKKQKKDKKHKKEKEKDKKKGASSAEEKRLVKQAKKFLKQRLKDDGTQQSGGAAVDNSLPPPDFEVTPISEDDYFQKNAEFSTWLRDAKAVHFNELTAEDARARFADFVKLWNARKLPARLYRGVDGVSMRRTQHSWGMRGAGAGNVEVLRGMEAAMEEEREAAAAGRVADRRKWNADQKERLEEMFPKATGHEARVEGRIARRDDAKARDASPDTARLPGGGDPFGGGDQDSFAAAKARQAAQVERRGRFGAIRAAETAQKVEQFAQKEDAAMAQFRALLDRGPIAIPKRN